MYSIWNIKRYSHRQTVIGYILNSLLPSLPPIITTQQHPGMDDEVEGTQVIIQGKEKKTCNVDYFLCASEDILHNNHLFEFVRESKKNEFVLPLRTCH